MTWLTKAEVAKLLGISKRSVLKRRGEFQTRIVHGNGGSRYEFALESLPLGAEKIALGGKERRRSPGGGISAEVMEKIRREYCRAEVPTISAVVDAVNAFCVRKGLEPLSRYKIERVIRSLPTAVKYATRRGMDEFMEKHGFFISRDWSSVPVNGIWCGDHRQVDVFCWLDSQRKRKAAPWVTVFEDMASRAIVGWCVSWKPNSDTIALAFRDAVLRAGKPRVIYIDNGKDYRSKYFSGRVATKFHVKLDAARRDGIVQRMGIEVVHALPYNHKAKPVESFFKFMALRFDRELPGWRGPDTASKPEKLEGELKRGEILTFEEFCQRVAGWFEWYNAEHVHSKTGRPPAAFYADASLRVMEILPLELDFHLLKRRRVRIGRRGIRLMGLDYYSEALFRAKLPMEEVEIRWNPFDLGEILVFDIHPPSKEENMIGNFICRVSPQADVDARGMNERQWEELKRVKRAQREKLREAIREVHGVGQSAESLGAKNTKVPFAKGQNVRPMFANSTLVIGPEAMAAKAAGQPPVAVESMATSSFDKGEYPPEVLQKTGTDGDNFVEFMAEAKKKRLGKVSKGKSILDLKEFF